eukprot:jgi/Botrbrau1/7839/Bobra.9_2s0018.1
MQATSARQVLKMEDKTSRFLIPALFVLYLEAAIVTVHATAVAGDFSASSVADSATIPIRPCPRILCIPPDPQECPREVQVCIKHFPGCPCCPSCPDSWPQTPPPPPTLLPPPPPVTCPQHLRCATECQPGQVPFCWEPRPDGCPCCLGCSGPFRPPITVPDPLPPVVVESLQGTSGACRNLCREHCEKFPQTCKNLICRQPMVCLPEPL